MNKRQFIIAICIFIIPILSFTNSSDLKFQNENSTSIYKSNEKMLKLMLLSFLGAQDLRNALKVAQEGVSKFPKSSYWWKKYIQILIWLDNYPKALNAALKAYKLTHDREFIIKAFNLAWVLNRWDLAVYLLEKYKLNIPFKKKVTLYYKAGDIFKLIEILKQKRDKYSLEQLIYIYYALGELDKALFYANEALKRYKNSLKFLILKAEILISQKKFNEANNLLKKYISSTKTTNVKFWRLLSDISWAVGDYKTSFQASLKLIKIGKAREQDFYRVLFSGEKIPNYIDIALKAWKVTKKKEFLQAAINFAYLEHKWYVLQNLFQRFPFLRKQKENLYLYIETLLHTNQKKLAYKLLKEDLNKTFSKDLFNLYITYLINKRNLKQLEKTLKKFRKYRCEAPESFIYAYLSIQNGKEAWGIYNTCKVHNLILKSDILYLLGRKKESRFIKYKVFLRLLNKLRNNPSLFKKQDFLNDFLYVSINFLPRSTYEKLLFKAREFLPSDIWRDLYLNFLFKEGEYQVIKYLKDIKGFYLEPWMEMDLYLYERNLLKLGYLLKVSNGFLPYGDTINAYNSLRRYKEALWYAYHGLNRNPYNYDIYNPFIDTASQISSYIYSAIQYSFQKGYEEILFFSDLSYKDLLRRYKLTANLALSKPLYNSPNTVINPPTTVWFISGIGRTFNYFDIKFYLSFLKNIQTNFGTGFKISLKPISRLELNFKAYYNYQSKDTLYLYLAGIKDFINVSANYRLLPRIFLNLSYTHNLFYSSDRKYLGTQELSEFSLTYKYRVSIPSIKFRFYVQNSMSHIGENKGSIKDILPNINIVTMPQSYNSLGGEFIFGEETRDFLRKKWIPFVKLGLSYNTRYKWLSNLTVGINKKVFDNKDHIILKFHLERNPIKNKGIYIKFDIGYNYHF